MAYSFVSVEEFLAYPLPVTDKQWEKIQRDQIEEVLEAATDNIKDYLDRDLVLQQYIERIRGTGRFTMMLDSYPIVSLDAVSGYDVTETQHDYGTGDFLIHSGAGIIEWADKLRNKFWVDQIWQITYTAGMDTIPKPVKHATMLEAIQLLSPLFRGGTNFGSISLVENADETIVDLLEKYKRKRMG